MAGKKMLIVDDNYDSALMLSMLLESEGHTVRVANAGNEALEIFEKFQPDIALLDINLPEIDGYELARRAKQLPAGKNLLLIAISGYGKQESEVQSAQAGFNHYLVKPVDFDFLLQLLKEASTTEENSAL